MTCKLIICLIFFANSTSKAYAVKVNNSTLDSDNATIIVDPTDSPLPVLQLPRMFDEPDSAEEYGDVSSEERLFKRSSGYGMPPPPSHGSGSGGRNGYQTGGGRKGSQYGGSGGGSGSGGMGGMPGGNMGSPCSSGGSYSGGGQGSQGYQQPSGGYKRKHKN